jgi:hypothetical protein
MTDLQYKFNNGRSLLLVAAWLFSMQAVGEETPVLESVAPETIIAAPPPVTPVPDVFDPIESARDYLSGKFTRFASYVDSYFGGNQHFQERNPSVMFVNLSRASGYGGLDKYDLAASVNLRLPISEGQFRLLVETDPQRNLEDEPVKSSTVMNAKPATRKSIALAARYALEAKNGWSFRSDVGIKFPFPAQPFVRAKVGYSTPIEDWRLTLGETVYWFSKDGVGDTTQIDMERQIDPLILFRSTSIAIWLKDKQNFDLSQSFSFYHTVSDRTSLIYQLSMFGISDPKPQMTDTVLLVFYRYRLHQKWLFFEITPQLHFPNANNYAVSPALSMRLQILFDDARASQ